jgi:hypothetical protein
MAELTRDFFPSVDPLKYVRLTGSEVKRSVTETEAPNEESAPFFTDGTVIAALYK